MLSTNDIKKFQIVQSKIIYNSKPVQLIGANAFHVFSSGSTDMNIWKIDIVREFIGNMKETPINGNTILDSNGAYLYSLQRIIDDNRANNRITILCPFGWDGLASTEFTGKSPAQTSWWNDYKIKLAQWAKQFKNQEDVWIEVWNEPYRYDRKDGYTDDLWMQNMNELVSIIRSMENENIILVPCAEQGQDESVLLNKGGDFLRNKSNILFDIHAYEKWLLENDDIINNRLEVLKQKNLPIFFGETAPLNAGLLMNTKPFLEIIYKRGLSVSAWVWKKDENDVDALLTKSGLPNNNKNNNWGTTFYTISTQVRNP
ncbi:cellulase family glycosylhydrolase [Flavobacterium sp.]|uniref:cellulase family glycosylhydrolase n=1 Tax=Flavobacterium sp. TaxID=239 RepID=UPI0026218A02|nr:cellulase family glycosylhydrolase [Flavobacterium sp.]MDG2432046.1 glycosyl hydrolase family 5 [Flavobacterium sp.]